jgi:hypothetical protein
MGREIDRKLRITAALLGTSTRKDLAAAFRRINPATSFGVERADKWLQGRSRPRERQVYEDWAALLDVGHSGQWIAECDVQTFLAAISARHALDPDALRQRAENTHRPDDRAVWDMSLAGTYVCYSHAWSPYFSGRLIRGELAIARRGPARGLLATYSESLPTGRLSLDGPVVAGKRAVHLDLHEAGGDSHLVLCLFPPTRPVSVLTGFMAGATIIGPDAAPSATRIAIVRLPAPSPMLREGCAYLAPRASIAADLVELGLPVSDPTLLDRRLGALLAPSGGNGLDQLSAASHRDLVALLDQAWLEGRPVGVRPGERSVPGEKSVDDPRAGVEA